MSVSNERESTPLPIRRLEESLINRIAAGEIIHRPASALKELIENSLDAQSTSIRITVKDGGMKLLQIVDNGVGIRKDDLPILAQRFTTSKLTKFSDLSKIKTYGFRGEALASMSHVAHLQVVTKTRQDGCAWKALYEDGVLVPPKKGQSSDPKPTAGNDGTTITIEDLFHNVPTRLMALRTSSEEYTRILDVVTKYAIHNPTVSFVCKKHGQSTADVSTPGGNATSKDMVKLLYGANVAKELMEVVVPKEHPESNDVNDANSDERMDVDEERVELSDSPWKCFALISSANYQAKKTNLLLFINHRLVDAPRLKKACESAYSAILPKGSFPFLYVSLDIIPQNVDVNVHPTKREVHFLNEEEIIEATASEMTQMLASKAQSRTFEYQSLLTGGVADNNSKYRDDESTSKKPSSVSQVQKVYSQHKVRNSQQDRTLESMFPIAHPATGDISEESDERDDNNALDSDIQQVEERRAHSKIKNIPESECYLTSVVNLRQEISAEKHNRLSEIINKHIFVGIVDLSKCLSLIQHSTKLYLVNHAALAEEFFYQLGLRQFGDFKRLKLEPPPNVRELVELAVSVEDGIKEAGLDVDAVIESIIGILVSRRDMLSEYFSLNINEDGQLTSIPMLMKDYTPNLEKLPLFLMRLGPQVNWRSEKECFQTFLRELALFYNPASLPGSPPGFDEPMEGEKAERWQLQHVLFPAMRRYFVAPKTLLDQDVVQIANLPDLYRVFERC